MKIIKETNKLKECHIDYENGYFCEVIINHEKGLIEYEFYNYNRKDGLRNDLIYISDENLQKIIYSDPENIRSSDSVFNRIYKDNEYIDKNDDINYNLDKLLGFKKFNNLYELDVYLEPYCLIKPNGSYLSILSYEFLLNPDITSKRYKLEDIIDKINSIDWIFTKIDKGVLNNPNYLDIFKFIKIYYILPDKENDEYMDLYMSDNYTDTELTDKLLDLIMNYE